MQSDTPHLAIIGSGGHADVVTEAAFEQFPNVKISIFCNYSNGKKAILGAPIVSYDNLHCALESERVTNYIIAVGQINLRRKLIEELDKSQAKPISVLHKTAVVANTAEVGLGVFCGPLSVVHSLSCIRDHSIINSMALVEHGSNVGKNCHIAPRATLLGNAATEENVFIGSNTTILPKIQISANVIVGANSLVNKSITKPGTYYGSPVKQILKN